MPGERELEKGYAVCALCNTRRKETDLIAKGEGKLVCNDDWCMKARNWRAEQEQQEQLKQVPEQVVAAK